MVHSTLIVITGPTAVGKTALTIELARYYDTPVINADSRQIYRELKIGTAAPSEEQLKQARHYFVGTKSIHDYYNASMYEQEVMSLLSESTTQINLLAGGSMMYIDAVCNGLDDIPKVDEALRNQVRREYEQKGLEWLQAEVQRLDPAYWAIVDRQNPQRLIHCVELSLGTGKPYSSYRKRDVKARNFEVVKVALERPREELYERINNRVDKMIADGLEEEARSVYPLRQLNSLQTVGYREMFLYFDGEITRDEAIRLIKQNSRHYAKRQLTWFGADKTIHWLDAKMDYEKQMDTIIGWLRADSMR